MAELLLAVVETPLVTEVMTWKDSIRGHTNNNRESAKVDAFSRFHDIITSLVSIMAHLFAN